MEGAKPKVAPFTQAVVAAMRSMYPEGLADKSFDNTGLLLEAPYQSHLNKSALIAVDLTTAVADEAIKRRDSIIVAYHPIIFRGLKSLTQSNSQTNTLLRLAQEGISVYCPHTAVDAAPGGLNDWLADIFGNIVNSVRTNITPVSSPPSGFESAGYGRILTFSTPQPLSKLTSLITSALGIPGVSVATPQSVPRGEKSFIPIKTVGICAGSGGSLLNGLDVDLLFTGELSHHEALAAIEKGKCVVTAFHSNSERAFFRERMQPVLVEKVKGEIERMCQRDEWNGSEANQQIDIGVSEVDADPYDIVMQGAENW